MDTTLINFRSPIQLQQSFDLICRYQSQTRTQALNQLMLQYVENNHQPIINRIQAQRAIFKNMSEIVSNNWLGKERGISTKTVTQGEFWEEVKDSNSYGPFHGEDLP
jgi:hypothetical protein